MPILIPVEVNPNDNTTASLNKLLSDDKYPDVKYGIKLGNKNIGFNGKFDIFPYFLPLLLMNVFVAEKKLFKGTIQKLSNDSRGV